MKYVLFLIISISTTLASCDVLFHGNVDLYNFFKIDSVNIPGKSLYTQSASKEGFFYTELYEYSINEEIVGEIYFKYYAGTNKLLISDIHVFKKGIGISKILIANAIKKHPYVDSIRGALGLDNFKAFDDSIKLDNSVIKAVESTPIYKVTRKLGYSRIKESELDIDLDDSSVIFEFGRD